MQSFDRMYFHLFNAVTDAISDIESCCFESAKARLIAAQQETEEMYIADASDPECGNNGIIY